MLAVGKEALKVQFDGLLDKTPCLLPGFTDSDARGQVRHVCSK
jgi:hypothetical protein